jgi:putative membrane protein
MVLEMALWASPRAMRAFGATPEFAAQSKVLAANQGLYNGFLVAGVYGAATVNRRILFMQAVPAGIGMLAVWMGGMGRLPILRHHWVGWAMLPIFAFVK